MQYILIAAVGLVVVLTIVFGVVISSSNSTNPEKQLAARLIGTEKIVGDAQTKLKSSQLRTLNSNLKIYLTNTNRDIAAPLLKSGVDVAKLDKTILASEAGTDITARLEDARLNVRYDRIYAIEMSTQLDKIIALMRQINNSTHSASLKTFLNDAYKNLEPTQKQFAEFNATNG